MQIKVNSSQLMIPNQAIYAASETLLPETLLPENIASYITAASMATRLSLRCSSLIIEALFDAAKYGTMVSLGLPKQVLISAVNVAKQLHTAADPDLETVQVKQVQTRHRCIELFSFLNIVIA